MTYAKIVADSVSLAGHRLTTMEVKFHRFVLAEFNTHRVFSRNSASSRARPVNKNLEDVWERPAMPYSFPEEQSGMQGGEESPHRGEAASVWHQISRKSVYAAEELVDLGIHKSVVNRILEPFMWHTVIVSSTAWDNFFHQRVSPLAQPEIRAVAQMMQDEYESSTPNELRLGDYHLPYISVEDANELASAEGVPVLENLIKISAARCARVSYLTHDGQRDLSKDIDLYEKLIGADPPHWSPLEHVAMADNWNVRQLSLPKRNSRGRIIFESSGQDVTVTLPKVGNFVGWTQQRHLVEQTQGVNTYA